MTSRSNFKQKMKWAGMIKQINQVYLINAGNDPHIASPANDKIFPHLGVISLGTAVKRYFPETTVRVYDNQVTPICEIKQSIKHQKPEVVGISVLATSYNTALDLAQHAKEYGATTIFGNDHAAVLGRNILRRREEVDYICTADIGEQALLNFLRYLKKEITIDAVPQLLYRTKEGIAYNDLPELPTDGDFNRWNVLDQIGIPKRTLFPKENWKYYRNAYMQIFGHLHKGDEVTGVTTMNRARGCARYKNECVFCGIKDLSLRFSSPKMFWEDVRSARDQAGANIIYEVFDSMSSAPAWLRKLVEAKPPDLEDTKFLVYTQAVETTPNLIDLYRRLGVYNTIVGFESGDDSVLKRLKGTKDSVGQNKKAAIMLKEAGIKVHACFVLGGPGETQESLRNTVDFARWLVDNDVISAVEAQPLYPEMNAPAGKAMMTPEVAHQMAKEMGFEIHEDVYLEKMRSKYSDDDNPDFDEFSRDWARIFCKTDWEDLIDAAREIREYATLHGYRSGSGVSRELADLNFFPDTYITMIFNIKFFSIHVNY